MLPEKLSTDLTSLGEGQDRPAIVVEMVIAEDGAVLSSTLFRALVRNHAKLAYNSVDAWFAGETPAPERVKAVSGLDAQLRLQDQVAQRLKARRHRQGALSLETIEPRAVFEGEMLTDLRVEQKNRAKELIEDFMIAANQATVSYLNGKGVPSFRRILRAPERWQRIIEVAARWGEHLPAEPDARALEAFLVTRRKGRDQKRDVTREIACRGPKSTHRAKRSVRECGFVLPFIVFPAITKRDVFAGHCAHMKG